MQEKAKASFQATFQKARFYHFLDCVDRNGFHGRSLRYLWLSQRIWRATFRFTSVRRGILSVGWPTNVCEVQLVDHQNFADPHVWHHRHYIQYDCPQINSQLCEKYGLQQEFPLHLSF